MEEAFLCIKYAYLQKNKSEGEKKKKEEIIRFERNSTQTEDKQL